MHKPMAMTSKMVLIALLTAVACGTPVASNPPVVESPPIPMASEPPTSVASMPSNQPEHQLYAGLTGDKEVPFVALNTSGEKLGVNKSMYSSTINVIWESSKGESIVIYAGGNGMPEHAVVGDDILEYSNYTKSTVDVTLIHPDGSRESIRANITGMLLDRPVIDLDHEYNQIAFTALGQNAPEQQVASYLDEGLFALDIAACAVAGAAFSFTGPGVIALVAACGGPLLHEYIQERRAQNLDVGPLEDLEGKLDLLGCGSVVLGSKSAIMDCVHYIVGKLADAERQANERVSNIPPAPLPAPVKPKYP